MTGIEKIIAKLEADAQSELDRLKADTEKECGAILEEQKNKAREVYDSAIRDGQENCRIRAERYHSAAELEARKQLLAFKQDMVSAVFAKAAKKLSSMPASGYVDFLAAQAASAASSGTEELIFNAQDAKNVGTEVVKAANRILGKRGKLTLSPETRDIPGGVIVRQGSVEANCAVDMLVQLRRNDLASQVAEILFA